MRNWPKQNHGVIFKHLSILLILCLNPETGEVVQNLDVLEMVHIKLGPSWAPWCKIEVKRALTVESVLLENSYTSLSEREIVRGLG